MLNCLSLLLQHQATNKPIYMANKDSSGANLSGSMLICGSEEVDALKQVTFSASLFSTIGTQGTSNQVFDVLYLAKSHTDNEMDYMGTKVEWWQATRVPQQLTDTSTSLISSLSKKQGICSYC